MSRLASIFALSIASTLLGCVSSAPTEQVSASAWGFSIEGQLASLSVSDLAAIVKAAQPKKIRHLRVINRNQVEVDDSPEWTTIGGWTHGQHWTRRVRAPAFSYYQVFKRIHGVWQQWETVVTTA